MFNQDNGRILRQLMVVLVIIERAKKHMTSLLIKKLAFQGLKVYFGLPQTVFRLSLLCHKLLNDVFNVSHHQLFLQKLKCIVTVDTSVKLLLHVVPLGVLSQLEEVLDAQSVPGVGRVYLLEHHVNHLLGILDLVICYSLYDPHPMGRYQALCHVRYVECFLQEDAKLLVDRRDKPYNLSLLDDQLSLLVEYHLYIFEHSVEAQLCLMERIALRCQHLPKVFAFLELDYFLVL